MTAAATGRPLRTVLIQPGAHRADLELRELWSYRDLLAFIVLRELKIRYKQAGIGIGWAIIQPVLTVAVFSLIFGRFAKIPSDGAPYPVFAFAGVLPWTYFAEALRRTSTGLVGDAELIRKIYFPRLLLPLAMTAAPLVDVLAGLVVLVALMAAFHMAPTVNVVLLPAFLVIAGALALAVGLWLGPLSVRFRDVMHALPFAVQVWMYASPVAYPLSLVPERWRLLYSLNPMVGVIEGFRWALLGAAQPDVRAIAMSGGFILACLVGGLFYFRRMERSFADVV